MEIVKYIMLFSLLMSIAACKQDDIDKAYLTIEYGNSAVQENNGEELIELTLSERLAEDLELYIKISGDAIEGKDYEEINDTVFIPAGYVSVWVPIRSIDNKEYDGNRNLNITFQVAPQQAHLVDDRGFSVGSMSIIDDEILLSIEASSNVSPMQMILRRKYSDLVNYDIGNTEEITSKGQVVIEGNGVSDELEVYLKPNKTIASEVAITYKLTFSGYDLEQSHTATSIFKNQEDVKILTFKKSLSSKIEIVTND